MKKFVAFLRGINVGGHNTVKNEELQEAFVSMGFTNISVYKQSGNIIFEAEATDLEALEKEVQGKLRQLLGSDIGIFIRTMAQLQKIVKSNPFKEANVKGASFLVTFSSGRLSFAPLPLKIPKSTAEVILITASEAYSVTRGHGDGGKPNPFVESKFKTQATTRNWNTIREITELG